MFLGSLNNLWALPLLTTAQRWLSKGVTQWNPSITMGNGGYTLQLVFANPCPKAGISPPPPNSLNPFDRLQTLRGSTVAWRALTGTCYLLQETCAYTGQGAQRFLQLRQHPWSATLALATLLSHNEKESNWCYKTSECQGPNGKQDMRTQYLQVREDVCKY